jgi:hypothetical protein
MALNAAAEKQAIIDLMQKTTVEVTLVTSRLYCIRYLFARFRLYRHRGYGPSS